MSMPIQHLSVQSFSSAVLSELQAALHSSIPLTRTMGIKVLNCSPLGLEMSAPLEPNINHASTAFGGSLATLATITSWGMVWLMLEQLRHQTQIIIQDSQLSYIRPVTKDFTAQCSWPSPDMWESMLGSVSRSGKGRIEMRSEIFENDLPCVSFHGRFVVQSQAAMAIAG
jgi:thioesterase domain-containing protein